MYFLKLVLWWRCWLEGGLRLTELCFERYCEWWTVFHWNDIISFGKKLIQLSPSFANHKENLWKNMCLNCRIIKHLAHSSLARMLVVMEGVHIAGRDNREQCQAAISAEVSVLLAADLALSVFCQATTFDTSSWIRVAKIHMKETLGHYYNVHL